MKLIKQVIENYFKEYIYIYIYIRVHGLVTSLYSRNWHNIANQSNIFNKKTKKISLYLSSYNI